MEFGLFTEFQAPAGRTDSAAFDESMAQMRLAEDLGYATSRTTASPARCACSPSV